MTPGKSITTANIRASVDFRVRTEGPGYCVVRAWASYGKENVLPAPSVWSPWLPLFFHEGRVTALLDTDSGCSRGARFEVRYSKDVN